MVKTWGRWYDINRWQRKGRTLELFFYFSMKKTGTNVVKRAQKTSFREAIIANHLLL